MTEFETIVATVATIFGLWLTWPCILFIVLLVGCGAALGVVYVQALVGEWLRARRKRS